ncbi:hypothetical protein CVT24_009201 [Panaeolus cyanescens]|uniref:Protein LCHN n=1 Tax=Panaeolus cyanescens TaxID=181874 RepID=A0A409Y8Y3_9AGAR|nr:hypothetical protein CVT24_009201 [Panaeolus cyanescens]
MHVFDKSVLTLLSLHYYYDIVAVFHASFHPTKGNIVDWSLKASDDLNLDQLEFSALPSGLHLIERDVIYFTKDNQPGVCVFMRRPTNEPGHRGFRLSSLGILLARSQRPRPWRHVEALKKLMIQVYSRTSSTPDMNMELTDEDWEPVRSFFEERKIRRADLGGAGDWLGWSEELDGAYSYPLRSNPTLHLPHLLQILGPSSLTIYKHVLGRKRILIYTLPPVEVACILCRVVADMCFEVQCQESAAESTLEQVVPSTWAGNNRKRLTGKHRDPISVLGMITLADIGRLEAENAAGRGWVACTTDALYLEKPAHYDLLIDLTTATTSGGSGKNVAARPTLYSSKPVIDNTSSRPKTTYRLSTIRFAWSDVKLWNEIERILSRSSSPHGNHPGNCCSPQAPLDPALKNKQITAWTDAWQVYEDVCILCAGLWMGLGGLNSWRSPVPGSESEPVNWGATGDPSSSSGNGGIRLEGDDDLSLGTIKSPKSGAYVRNVGMGIEGRPAEASTSTLKSIKRSSAMSWSSGRTLLPGSASISNKGRHASSSTARLADAGERPLVHLDEDGETQKHSDLDLWTTLALLQTFHAHTAFQLSVLEDVISKQRKKRKGQPVQGATGIEASYSGSSSDSSANGSSSSSSSSRLAPSHIAESSSTAPTASASSGPLLPENGIPASSVVTLTPKDILAFELAPMSAFDARYLEWLAKEYTPTESDNGADVKVVLKRGWKDIIGAVLGYV